MNRFVIIAALAALVSHAANAGQPSSSSPHFSGENHFPIAQLGSDDDVMNALYGGHMLSGTDYLLCQPQCTLSVKGRMSWNDTLGNQHVGLVVAAEANPTNAAHADGAYIGMVDLLHIPHGWQLNAGSPTVATAGSFGQVPPIELVSAGKFGMAVIVKPAFMNQGEIQQNWNLYLQVRPTSEFKQVLSVPMLEDNSGKCDGDDQCRSHDFTTDVIVSDEGNSLYVRVTRHPHVGIATFKDYTITP